jgi:hypothetical protein
VTPFLDSSKVDAPANLSSPSPYPYIEVEMVMMLNKRVKSLRRGSAPLHLENTRK